MNRPLSTCVLLGAALCLTLTACPSRDRKPAGAVREFLQAVEVGRLNMVYAQLDPGSQKHLQDLSRMAEDQTGGGRKSKPEEMLVVSMAKTGYRSGEIKTVSQDGDQAKVRVSSADKKYHEVFSLRRHDGHWRIVLPTQIMQRLVKSAMRKTPAPAAP